MTILTGLSTKTELTDAVIFTPITNLLLEGELGYQQKTISQVKSKVHQTYSAVKGVTGYGP